MFLLRACIEVASQGRGYPTSEASQSSRLMAPLRTISLDPSIARPYLSSQSSVTSTNLFFQPLPLEVMRIERERAAWGRQSNKACIHMRWDGFRAHACTIACAASPA